MAPPSRRDVSCLLERLLSSQDSTCKHFVNLLTRRKSNATEHLPDKGVLIDTVWKRCAILLLLARKVPRVKSIISSMRECPPKSNWTTFLDKLSSSDQAILDTLHLRLFQTLLLESISRERDCQPFWTPAYKELSARLWSPIVTDSADSVSTSSTASSTRPGGRSPFWTTTRTRAPSRNSPKICSPSYTSTAADKWASGATSEGENETPIRSLKLKVNPTEHQRKLIDSWIHTSNFVYNRTVEAIQNGDKAKFINLRDKLVTSDTKKTNAKYVELSSKIDALRKELAKLKNTDQNTAVRDGLKARMGQLKLDLKNASKGMKSARNPGVHDWETETPKDIRAAAVKEVCSAYKSGFTNLQRGNIKHFRLKFKKRSEPHQMIALSKQLFRLNVDDGTATVTPTIMEGDLKIGKKQVKRLRKSHANLAIDCDCKLVRQHGEYFLIVPIKTTRKAVSPKAILEICGIDPGVRSFMTCFDTTGVTEHKHNEEMLRALHKKIDALKRYRTRPRERHQRNRYRKRTIRKYERRADNLIDHLHWSTINSLVSQYDVIMYGDIKSHGIVKNSGASTLNRNMCALKFYKFKQRLTYKANVRGTRIVCVNEAYTSQTCSACGHMYKPGASKVYNCKSCKAVIDRDFNGAKNMMMKGILTTQV